jgi:cytochrome b6-f complex iron-sulfur subunit
LTWLWIGFGALALGEFIAMGVAYLRPRKSRAERGGFGSIINAGPVESFMPNSVTAFRRGQFYLSRLEDGGFLALSRKCTHLGCTLPWEEKEKRFVCPCHASAFDMRGNVANSPASRALDMFPVTIENDNIRVDTSKPIRRSEFRTDQVTYPKELS